MRSRVFQFVNTIETVGEDSAGGEFTELISVDEHCKDHKN